MTVGPPVGPYRPAARGRRPALNLRGRGGNGRDDGQRGPDRGRRGRYPGVPGVGTVLLVILLVVASTAIGLRLVLLDDSWVIAATAAAPYLMLGAPAALVVAALGRRRLLAALAAIVTVLAATTQLPLFGAAPAPAPAAAASLTMMTANLKLGSADAAALRRSVEQHHVDLLTTQELTPPELDRLRTAGLDRLLPYAAADARPGAAGVGIWSRYPLGDVHRVDSFHFAFVTARVDAPTLTFAPTVVATHMPGPWPQSADYWARDMAALPGTLRRIADAAGAGAVLVGGDLNATFDCRRFRSLLHGGFHDAAAQSGAGLRATYPGNTWVPPLIAIDHVLTYHAVATGVQAVPLPGSDHRALLVRVSLPRAEHAFGEFTPPGAVNSPKAVAVAARHRVTGWCPRRIGVPSRLARAA